MPNALHSNESAAGGKALSNGADVDLLAASLFVSAKYCGGKRVIKDVI